METNLSLASTSVHRRTSEWEGMFSTQRGPPELSHPVGKQQKNSMVSKTTKFQMPGLHEAASLPLATWEMGSCDMNTALSPGNDS